MLMGPNGLLSRANQKGPELSSSFPLKASHTKSYLTGLLTRPVYHQRVNLCWEQSTAAVINNSNSRHGNSCDFCCKNNNNNNHLITFEGHVASGNCSLANYWQKPAINESDSGIFPLGKIMKSYLRQRTS